MPVQQEREAWILLIESQSTIDGRFTNVRRINSNAGNGYWSLIFKAIDSNNPGSKEVVLKFYNPLKLDPYRQSCFERESDLLYELVGQQNILKLIQNKTTILVPLSTTPPIPYPLQFYATVLADKSMKDFIYEDEDYNYYKNMLLFREMCKAIQRIHNRGICHRDIKPDNFLIIGEGLFLSDFGTARKLKEKIIPLKPIYSAPVGDRRYTAPELLFGLIENKNIFFSSDIYSLGVVLFEMFTKSILSSYIFKNQEIINIITKSYSIPEEKRFAEYTKAIKSFSASHKLPSVLNFNDNIHKNLAKEIDWLYKYMSSIDFRKRLVNFDRIFLRINICLKILDIYIKQKIEKEKKRKFWRK